MSIPTSRVKAPVTFPAMGDRVQHEQYGAGTVTLLDVYHTVIDFDGHGLRRFVTNRIVVERTDDPGPTPSERRAIVCGGPRRSGRGSKPRPSSRRCRSRRAVAAPSPIPRTRPRPPSRRPSRRLREAPRRRRQAPGVTPSTMSKRACSSPTVDWGSGAKGTITL